MDPVFFSQSRSDAQSTVRKLVESMPRSRVTEDEPGYLHAEVKSKIFGFVDDVELVFDDEGRIDYRSASRVGHSDLGVNRRRMEEIRHRLLALPGFTGEPPQRSL